MPLYFFLLIRVLSTLSIVWAYDDEQGNILLDDGTVDNNHHI